MRHITQIIIHCSATPEGQPISVHDIDRWHRQRGFDQVGYHYVITLNGEIQEGRPLNEVGAHCYGHNAHSVGICYIGGLRPCDPKPGDISWPNKVAHNTHFEPADTRTDAQRQALTLLVQQLRSRFPGATVHGHNEFANKACPCFDVHAEFG